MVGTVRVQGDGDNHGTIHAAPFSARTAIHCMKGGIADYIVHEIAGLDGGEQKYVKMIH